MSGQTTSQIGRIRVLLDQILNSVVVPSKRTVGLGGENLEMERR